MCRSIFRLHRTHEMQTIVNGLCGAFMQPLPNYFGLLLTLYWVCCIVMSYTHQRYVKQRRDDDSEGWARACVGRNAVVWQRRITDVVHRWSWTVRRRCWSFVVYTKSYDHSFCAASRRKWSHSCQRRWAFIACLVFLDLCEFSVCAYRLLLLTYFADLSSSCYDECRIAVFRRLLCKLLLYGSTGAVIGLISACGWRMDGPHWWMWRSS